MDADNNPLPSEWKQTKHITPNLQVTYCFTNQGQHLSLSIKLIQKNSKSVLNYSELPIMFSSTRFINHRSDTSFFFLQSWADIMAITLYTTTALWLSHKQSASITLSRTIRNFILVFPYVTRIPVRVSDTIRIGYADTHFPKKHQYRDTARIINNYI